MDSTKTFKAGESIESLAAFVKSAADELIGDTGSPVLSKSVQVVVKVRGAKLVIDDVLVELGLEAVKEDVETFLQYRTDEKKNPVKSAKSLRRLLSPFRDLPMTLRTAIDESIQFSWIGLFFREGKEQATKVDRTIERGESDGGEW